MKIKLKTIGYLGIGFAVLMMCVQFYLTSFWDTFVFIPVYLAALLLGDTIGKIWFADKKES